MVTSILVAIALAFFGVAQAPAPASVEGVVVQAGSSIPISGARVFLGTAQALTDGAGRFQFSSVTPGRYHVSAIHNEYAAPRRGGASDVAVAPGQAVRDVMIALVPNGSISGRIRISDGTPAVNAAVQVLMYTYEDGRRILVPVGSATTNNEGEYRLDRLTPRSYVIKAVAAGAEPHVAVYYAGATDPSFASPIELPAGVDFTGVDFTLTDAAPVSIRGIVVNGVTGEPAAGAAVELVPKRGAAATGSLQRTTASASGAFEFRYMAPGSYEVIASARTGAGMLAASASAEIAGQDADNLTLVLQPQFSVAGEISIDDLQPGPGPQNRSNIRIELRRTPFVPELLVPLPNIAGDGAFSLAGVTPGDYRLIVRGRGWRGYVKSAYYGAVDALNGVFHIDAPGPLDIRIGLNTGSLDAAVPDRDGRPHSGATVVLVPDPPRRDRFDLYAVAASDASGRAHFENIAPGDYRVFAWDDVPADAWLDEDFIRPYEDRASPLHIEEGGYASLELRLITDP